MATAEERRFAETALRKEFVTRQQLDEVERLVEQQLATGAKTSVAEVLLAKGYLTGTQEQAIRRAITASGPMRIGDFEILAELGRGAMGTVYKARDTTNNELCALKLLPAHIAADPSLLTRFRREAQASARLNHPNVVRAYRVGEADGQHFFSMEFVDGTSVERMIAESGRLEIGAAVEIVKQVCRGLVHAHEAGVIHRDIKPANILVTREGVAKLADLGLVREAEAHQTRVTMTGAGMGTPAYMPPEQAKGASTADARSDIYALGATFYHMLTGKVPYEGDTALEVLQMHESGRLKSPRSQRPEIPSWLDMVVCKMMQRKPENRFATARDVLAALERRGPAQAPVSDTAMGLRAWQVQVRQADGSIRRLKMDAPTLHQLLLAGKVSAGSLARFGPEGLFKTVSQFPELMEVLGQAKTRREKMTDSQLLRYYKEVETAILSPRKPVRVRGVPWVWLEIAFILGMVALGFVFRQEVVHFIRRVLKLVRG